MNPIRHFEELSNNAWPALQTLEYDGWTLRFADGVTRRSNSVSMLYPSSLAPDEKIRFCEKIYRQRNIAPCFKITEISTPAGIDRILEERGYRIQSVISFQTLDISNVSLSADKDVRMEQTLRPGWIDDFIRMNGFDLARKPVYEDIMERLNLPKCLVSVMENDRTIGVGLGVADGSYVGLFDIVVDPEFRRTGYGRRIVEQILAWAGGQGVKTAYLQVLAENHPAIRLYKKMGFREAYRYWYRVKQ